MKSTFADLAFKHQHALGAVNSVNWARVLAQIVYYGYASLKFAGSEPASFSAWKMEIRSRGSTPSANSRR